MKVGDTVVYKPTKQTAIITHINPDYIVVSTLPNNLDWYARYDDIEQIWPDLKNFKVGGIISYCGKPARILKIDKDTITILYDFTSFAPDVTTLSIDDINRCVGPLNCSIGKRYHRYKFIARQDDSVIWLDRYTGEIV